MEYSPKNYLWDAQNKAPTSGAELRHSNVWWMSVCTGGWLVHYILGNVFDTETWRKKQRKEREERKERVRQNKRGRKEYTNIIFVENQNGI